MNLISPRSLIVLPILGCLLACGCGGSDGTTGATTPTQAKTTPAKPSGPTPASVCAELPTAGIAKVIAKVSGRPPPRLKTQATGTSKLVACRYAAPGLQLHINLDTASRANRRYRNRVVELAQFGYTPELAPHPVSGVGDSSTGGGANWIPASHQLLTADRDRYLIVDFYVRGVANGTLRDGAASLAKLAFSELPGN